MNEADALTLGEEPSCVGKATDITGHDLTAWVIVRSTWRGHPRFQPQVERYFVHWSIHWRGRRRRTFEKAERIALAVLHRYDSEGERRG